MAMPSLSVKKHRDRKNPATAEFEAKRRRETNAARPKQEVTIQVFEVGNSRIEKITGPYRD